MAKTRHSPTLTHTFKSIRILDATNKFITEYRRRYMSDSFFTARPLVEYFIRGAWIDRNSEVSLEHYFRETGNYTKDQDPKVMVPKIEFHTSNETFNRSEKNSQDRYRWSLPARKEAYRKVMELAKIKDEGKEVIPEAAILTVLSEMTRMRDEAMVPLFDYWLVHHSGWSELRRSPYHKLNGAFKAKTYTGRLPVTKDIKLVMKILFRWMHAPTYQKLTTKQRLKENEMEHLQFHLAKTLNLHPLVFHFVLKTIASEMEEAHKELFRGY